jgi:NAD-dependent SIR2 family protein deacetylase|nr:MAG TPA: Transcription initiation factor IIE, alpha FINGER, Transcription [Caudoviricetes sp.]
MIKIIELGTIRKQKCQRCGCLFSYENEDVITERNEHMLLGFHKIYINCPQCEQKIVLVDTKLMRESNFENGNRCPYYYGEIDPIKRCLQ